LKSYYKDLGKQVQIILQKRWNSFIKLCYLSAFVFQLIYIILTFFFVSEFGIIYEQADLARRLFEALGVFWGSLVNFFMNLCKFLFWYYAPRKLARKVTDNHLKSFFYATSDTYGVSSFIQTFFNVWNDFYYFGQVFWNITLIKPLFSTSKELNILYLVSIPTFLIIAFSIRVKSKQLTVLRTKTY